MTTGISKIMVGIDGSKEAENAADYAILAIISRDVLEQVVFPAPLYLAQLVSVSSIPSDSLYHLL
jgi:hypothetical protein